MTEPAPNNSKVIHLVAATVCLAVLIGLVTEALCVYLKIPDMGGPVSGGFTHTVDTLVGAVIAMLINTRPQEQRPAEDGKKTDPNLQVETQTQTTIKSSTIPPTPTEPTPVIVANTPSDPVPVTPQT